MTLAIAAAPGHRAVRRRWRPAYPRCLAWSRDIVNHIAKQTDRHHSNVRAALAALRGFRRTC